MKEKTIILDYVNSIDEIDKTKKKKYTEKDWKELQKVAKRVGESLQEFYGEDLEGFYETINRR